MDDISQLLNESVSHLEPYLTPLYYTFPDIDLCQLYVEHQADPQQLSFLHCYFTYRKRSLNSENQFYKFVYNLATKYKLDCNETDINGKNCAAIIYESLVNHPGSTDPNYN